MNLLLVAAVISFAVAYIMTPLVRRLATKWGVVAHPGGRRVHRQATPLMGGAAMYAGFVIAVAAAIVLNPEYFDRSYLGILAGATFIATVGIVDDRYELPGWVQALCILISGAILALFGVTVQYITNPFRGGHLLWLGAFGVPVTILWVLMVTKALDCMDGLDGLAAGISIIAAGTLMLMAMGSSPMVAVMAVALLGAALGFLRFNYPPAKIFMGTVGAQFLGFTLAAISIAGAYKIATLVAVAVPVMVLGVPLLDTTFVVVKRAAGGKKIHEADTTHLHHRLLERGLSHRQVIWVIYGLTFAFCAVAYALFSYVK